jgi:hypothetical protein
MTRQSDTRRKEDIRLSALYHQMSSTGKHEVKHEFLYLPNSPMALMGRDLCKLRAQITFDSDGTAILKLREPEAKILTLMVVQ